VRIPGQKFRFLQAFFKNIESLVKTFDFSRLFKNIANFKNLMKKEKKDKTALFGIVRCGQGLNRFLFLP